MAIRRKAPRTLVVLITCPTHIVARQLAHRLVKERLAACVNILPDVHSVFRWRGKIDRCREALLFVKTSAARFERLKRAVIAWHPYDVPEVVALPTVFGHQPYLRWVIASTVPA